MYNLLSFSFLNKHSAFSLSLPLNQDVEVNYQLLFLSCHLDILLHPFNHLVATKAKHLYNSNKEKYCVSSHLPRSPYPLNHTTLQPIAPPFDISLLTALHTHDSSPSFLNNLSPPTFLLPNSSFGHLISSSFFTTLWPANPFFAKTISGLTPYCSNP